MHFKIIILLLVCFILNNHAYAQEETPDLGAMVEQFQSCTENINQKTKTAELLIFVSFSMPEQSLKSWAQQADKLGQNLILRGLVNNSIQETTQKSANLFLDSQHGGFNIDPEKFTQYQIKSVPAVVLVTGTDHDLVYGDTSLEAALEKIANKGSDLGRKQASDYLKWMRKNR